MICNRDKAIVINARIMSAYKHIPPPSDCCWANVLQPKYFNIMPQERRGTARQTAGWSCLCVKGHSISRAKTATQLLSQNTNWSCSKQ